MRAMNLLTLATVLFAGIHTAQSQPTTKPADAATTRPTAFAPTEPELAAAFATFEKLRALTNKATIEEIGALQVRPAQWDDAAVLKDLATAQTMKVAVVDGKAGENVAMLIIRIDPDEKPVKLGVTRLVKVDGHWRALALPPAEYQKGEITPEQLKAFEPLRPWARARMNELRR